MFHELATNAGNTAVFRASGWLQGVLVGVDYRLNIAWDETEGADGRKRREPGFGTKLLNPRSQAFDGKTEISFLRPGFHLH